MAGLRSLIVHTAGSGPSQHHTGVVAARGYDALVPMGLRVSAENPHKARVGPLFAD